jgi:predicted AAA+ superfamily ATPase
VSSDTRGFLALYPPPVIFDEVQYAPDLLPYLKERIDAHRDQRGQYLLTGSQNLLLLDRVTESLAGRAAILRLLPLSWRESLGQPDAPRQALGEKIEPGYVIHPGEIHLPLAPGVRALPFAQL